MLKSLISTISGTYPAQGKTAQTHWAFLQNTQQQASEQNQNPSL